MKSTRVATARRIAHDMNYWGTYEARLNVLEGRVRVYVRENGKLLGFLTVGNNNLIRSYGLTKLSTTGN